MWRFLNFLLGAFCLHLLVKDVEGWEHFYRGRGRGGFVGVPKVSKQYNLPEEQWFDQKLDHSKPTIDITWKQRYFANATFYKPGGPVFLLIGGEQEISPLWMVEGQWIEYAREFNAMCFQLEHRYYGKSRPKDSLSTKNLEYLTSQQALGDLAHFIYIMNIKHELSPKTKWIAFGGSYPGSLAAWLRAKYPHLVHAAVSTSAPLLAKLDFREYFTVVRKDLQSFEPSCEKTIREATGEINMLVKTHMGRSILQGLFNLCSPLDIDENEDIANFYEILAGNIAAIAQYNNDNREFEGTVDSGMTLTTVCDVMKNESIEAPINRYATINKMMLQIYGKDCLKHQYDPMIDDMKQEEWESRCAREGDRQWLYQTCTEFGFFQTSASCSDTFGDKFPLGFYLQQCQDIFGKRFNKKLVQKGVERTNREYGEMNIKTTRVVFVHGSLDPWHALGMTKTLDPSLPTIYIPGTAHCADMYPTSPNDPPQLRAARRKIGMLIEKWLQEN